MTSHAKKRPLEWAVEACDIKALAKANFRIHESTERKLFSLKTNSIFIFNLKRYLLNYIWIFHFYSSKNFNLPLLIASQGNACFQVDHQLRHHHHSHLQTDYLKYLHLIFEYLNKDEK